MNQMRERFEDVAGTAAPPSRLSADTVYAGAFRRRRQRVTAWTVSGIVAGALVVAFGAGVLPGADRGSAPAGPTPGGPTPARSVAGAPKDRDGALVNAVATDAQHLYAAVKACTGAGSALQCKVNLAGSDDAGKTWTVRWKDLTGFVSAPAPGILLRTVEQDNPEPKGPKLLHIPWISDDGGRTWTQVQAGPVQVPQVQAGGWIACAPPRSIDDPCALLAFDPAGRRSAPLFTQPDMEIGQPVEVPASAGLWVTGRERGGSHRPAVAVSADRGRTWKVHVFGIGEADFPTADLAGSAVPFSVDGVTGYTVITVPDRGGTTGAGPTSPAEAGSKIMVYRTGDGGGTWKRVNPGQTLPRIFYEDGDTYIAADGTLVVQTDEDAPLRWHASTDGGQTYHRADLPGLGDALLFEGDGFRRVLVTGPGSYLAYDEGAVYRSADGLHWTRTEITLPR